MQLSAQQIILLLLIVSLVSMVARRLRLPSSSGLILTGLALALLPLHGEHIELTRFELFTAFLPALIFESALRLRASDLRADWLPLTVMVTLGVAVNLAVSGVTMRFLLHWQWRTALMFGALTSATDPIAVLSTFKQANVQGRPRLLAEAESLFNDGIAVVALGLVSLSTGSVHSGALALTAGESLVRTAVGAVAIGLVVGWLLTRLMGTMDDPLIETTLTFVGAYGAYYLADRASGSGILAATAAGLVMGNYGLLSERYVSARGREIVEALWDFVAFIASALVFLLMGFSLARIPLHTMFWPVVMGIVCGLSGRACAVYLSSALVSRSARRIPGPLQHLLVWGGQRGALSLILAVAVFKSVPNGGELLAATVGLVTFSILVQGLTFRPLLNHLLRTSWE